MPDDVLLAKVNAELEVNPKMGPYRLFKFINEHLQSEAETKRFMKTTLGYKHWQVNWIHKKIQNRANRYALYNK